MSLGELVKRIPGSLHERLSDRLIDALLETKEGDKVPSSIARKMLYHWMRDQLASGEGLANLLEALAAADPPMAADILDEFGLEEVKRALTAGEGGPV